MGHAQRRRARIADLHQDMEAAAALDPRQPGTKPQVRAARRATREVFADCARLARTLEEAARNQLERDQQQCAALEKLGATMQALADLVDRMWAAFEASSPGGPAVGPGE